MIYNLPIHFKEKKNTPTTRFIAMPEQGKQPYSLFVGDDTLHKKFNTGAYGNNITVHAISLARQTMKMYLQQGIVPEFVICYAPALAAIEPLLHFMQRNKKLRNVPFFVFMDDITIEDREAIRNLGRVDDILTAQTSVSAFRMKLEFARRLRNHTVETVAMKEMVKQGLRRKINYMAKRIFDIVCAGTALLIVSPVLLLIAILIKLESKGPVFYISLRAGSRYKVFKFYKFRTMVADADKQVAKMKHLNQYNVDGEKGGPVFFKVSNDPRITRLGAFLRNTSLDELPQLLNVLLGDMSLVGNRPLPLYEAASLTTDHHAGRFDAPAGITGLWQIKKRGNGNMSVEERISLDIDYASRHSFLYDIWIIANTPSALVQKENV